MKLYERHTGVLFVRLKIKRLKINKAVKTVLSLVSIVSICSLSYLIYREINFPVVTEEQEQLYSYRGKPSVSYSVLLAPNNIYEGSSLGEGIYYLTNCTDSIQAEFDYEFSGDKSAALKGFYEISAVVEGYTMIDESHITIWEKKFVVVPRTEVEASDRTLRLKESADIHLSEYRNFAAEVSEYTKVSIPVQLKVAMDVSLKVEESGEQAEINDSPAIVLPLDDGYFSISKLGTEEKPGSITKTRKIQLPPDKLRINMYKAGVGTSIFLILGLVIFTEGTGKSRFSRQLKKIYKNHGSRMVALDSELLAVSLDNCSIVRSIEDLVRISDEIGRPIMYEYSEGYKQIVQFYVLDDRRTYLYVIKDNHAGSNIEIVDDRNVTL